MPDVVTVQANRRCLETSENPCGLQFDKFYYDNSCINRRLINAYGIGNCQIQNVAIDIGLRIENTTFYYPAGIQPYFPCAAASGQQRNYSLQECNKRQDWIWVV